MDILGGAPRVLGYPRPVVAQCGTDATLRCQIDGDPRPDVIWERKNVLILSEQRYKISEEGKVYLLTITGVTQEDAGQYICKARNSIGETYAAASLKVEGELPEHNREIIQLKKNDVKENGDFGESLNGYNMVENGANEKKMNGQHKWKSQANEKLKEFDLTSNDKPRFLIKPLSLRVDRGEDAAFSCKIWGTPLPEVAWEKDRKKLNDIFESSHFNVSYQDGGWFQLKIYGTRMPDKGVYTCKAVNCHGEALAGAVLLVEPIPEREETKMSSNIHISSQRSPKHRGGRFSLSKLTEELPVNVSKVKKFVVTEGKHAKFRCFVTGKPKPEIIWKKDGVPLEPDRRHLVFEDREGYYTLKVLYCKMQDTGLYVCAASNALGNTLSAVHLTVKGPSVRFKRLLKDVEVKERDVAVLECEVPDEMIPAAWYLEDQRLMPSSKYGMEQKGTRRRLTIHDVGTDDDGVYLCEMPDGAKSIAELAVKDRPNSALLTWVPAPNTPTTTRSMFVLERQEVGSQEWQKCFTSETATSAEVSDDSVQCEGDYRFRVCCINKYGRSGHVEFIPLSELDSNKIVEAGDAIVLYCEVTHPFAKVSWYKDGEELQVSDGLNIQSDGNMRRLVIQSAEASHSGVYTCETSGDVIKFNVDVEEPPVKILRKSELKTDLKFLVSDDIVLECELSRCNGNAKWYKDGCRIQGDERFCEEEEGNSCDPDYQDLMAGDDLILACEVSRANAPVQWYCNDRLLTSDSHTFIESYGTLRKLIISNIQPSDSGKYVCDAVNDKMINIIRIQAESVTLTSYVSKESAAVRWLKDWTPVEGERFREVMDGHKRSLTIQPLRRSDAGEYTCDANTDQMHFSLLVKVPRVVEFLTELHNTTVLEGEDATYKCVVSPEDVHLVWLMDNEAITLGDRFHVMFTRKMEAVTAEEFGEATLETEISLETGEVQWMRQGVVIQSGARHTLAQNGCKRSLTIQNLSLSDRGTYRCETLHDRTQVKLNVEPRKISIRKSLTDQETFERETASFEVELSHADVEGIWQKDGIRVKPNNQFRVSINGLVHSLTLTNLTLEDTGTIVFSAEGVRSTARLTVKEHKLEIVQDLEDLYIQEDQNAVFMCEVSLEDVAGEWYKDGTKHFLLMCNIKTEDAGEIRFVARDVESTAYLEVEVLRLGSIHPKQNCWLKVSSMKSHSRIIFTRFSSCQFFFSNTMIMLYAATAQSLLIVKELEDVEVTEPEPASFQCEVSVAINKPPVWTLNGATLHTGPDVRLEDHGTIHKLTLKNTSVDMSGTIKFTLGKAKSTATFTVIGK
ncbi:hypothetical protein XENOCAPTIV_021194 [Xenoophorus captivus]|uniref:Obscurin like cytoskeletal adaptor 1a n=1 Tax=Xenoophorus captivus TaxID=1517983 RepID=A0ABV0Q5P7_9TELE